MTYSTAAQLGSKNLCAFLDMIASSEIGAALLAESDDGYNVMVGSTPEHPLLFPSYWTHPNILNAQCDSTAAGRYQLLHRYYVAYSASLHLTGFDPFNQDAIAVQQIRECHALPMIEAGQFAQAVAAVAHIWASLPGNTYNQHKNTLSALQAAYIAAGGTLA